ncbi:MAG: hypothetical protein LUD78_01905 [Clostridiales bacterium]|nr:hypothetical protein [Clostridiales bacterium]
MAVQTMEQLRDTDPRTVSRESLVERNSVCLNPDASHEEHFYHNAGNIDPTEPKPVPEENKDPDAPTLDANALASLLTSNPELLAQVLKSVQLANS